MILRVAMFMKARDLPPPPYVAFALSFSFSLTHTHTHTLTQSLDHSFRSLSFPSPLPPLQPVEVALHPLARSRFLSHTLCLIHSLTHPPTVTHRNRLAGSGGLGPGQTSGQSDTREF